MRDVSASAALSNMDFVPFFVGDRRSGSTNWKRLESQVVDTRTAEHGNTSATERDGPFTPFHVSSVLLWSLATVSRDWTVERSRNEDVPLWPLVVTGLCPNKQKQMPQCAAESAACPTPESTA